jgi:hypothetical protein
MIAKSAGSEGLTTHNDGFCDSCNWVAALPDGVLEAEFGSEAGGAAMAVALGKPRPGHSVLGQGTFAAAQPAWETLAERYIDDQLGRPEGLLGSSSELALYMEQGGTRVGIAAMQDTSPAGLATAGGAMVVVAFPPPPSSPSKQPSF